MASPTNVQGTTKHVVQSSMERHLLDLPLEILTEILETVIPSSLLAKITVRWMFIRTNFQIRYLPITPLPQGSASLLLVCKKFHHLIGQMLYGLPYWRCDCRLERLRMQIGLANFASIKKMVVSMDDLRLMADATELEATAAFDPGRVSQSMRFPSLEEVHCEGYEREIISVLSECVDHKTSHDGMWEPSSTMRYTAQNAVTLCISAAKLLYFHPRLNILAQQKGPGSELRGTFRGGSDAIDTSAGRVQWRFLKKAYEMNETEEAVTLGRLRSLVESICCHDDLFGIRASWPAALAESLQNPEV